MIKDYRPYTVKKAWYRLLNFYVKHRLSPQLASLGSHGFIVKPWHIEFFGGPIRIGDHITLLGCSDKKTRLTVWADTPDVPGITIGDHVLISPGVRISAAHSITISDSCMLASNAYITDSDWHGIYDRSLTPETKHQVTLEENVWIGDSAIVCKDVTIGRNSIIGAGSVVVTDIPSNVMAAGNPAKVVKILDPDEPMVTRKDRFADTDQSTHLLDALERENLKDNTLIGWIRSLILPPFEKE